MENEIGANDYAISGGEMTSTIDLISSGLYLLSATSYPAGPRFSRKRDYLNVPGRGELSRMLQ
jgi:hypothetical protein